ncbi:MAG: hypothetical protein IAF38_01035 [Bacteroidia bacterium]|nr:hypothetical protein [Bacteroidia bacterium]
MDFKRRTLLTILFVIFIFKILTWVLLSFGIFVNVVNGFGGLFIPFFKNSNRAFILVIPFFLLSDLCFSSGKKVYLLLAFVYFVVYGFSILTDTVLREWFPEITGDILEIVAFCAFSVPLLFEFLKHRKAINPEKKMLTFHYARFGWAVFLTLFGIGDLFSSNRIALKSFAEYALVFCAITFITQFLSDKEKI